ncbi:MAG: DUF4129 domain-containing protein [Chloroflexota bacterium]|nr:DUF4129 domain-containing protein [Chloroflexota bacterium]
MNRLYASLLVLLELLWTYAVIVALTEWGWIGWDRPPISLPAATLLAAAALAPAILPDSSESIFVRFRGAVLPLQVLLLAFVVRTQTADGYPITDFDWFIALWDAPQLFLGAVFYGVFLLWRAGTATSPLPVPERLHTRFLLGLAVLFFALLLAFFADDDADARSPLLSLAVYSVTYFAAGMAAIAVANLRDIRREMVRRSDTGLPSLREWMAVPLATIVGMLFTSLVFSALFSFDLARLLLIPLEYLARGIAIAILYGLIWPLSFVAGALTWFLGWIGGAVRQEEQEGEGPQLTDEPLLVEQGETVLFSETALLLLQWGLGILAAVVVILILAKALNRFRRDGDGGGEEEVTESLDPWSNFKHDLNLFVGWLLGLVRRKRKPVPVELPTPVAVTGDTAGEAREFTIREIYQGLLWEGRAAGHARRDAETPFEYGTRIHPLDTTEEAALDDITQAYVEARYGAADPAPDRLRWLNRQWLRLRAAMTRGEE